MVGGGLRFSALVQTGPGAHPASYTMGTGSFPGVKRSGPGVDHPPLYSSEVKERVEMPLLQLWAFVAFYRVKFTLLYRHLYSASSGGYCVIVCEMLGVADSSVRAV